MILARLWLVGDGWSGCFINGHCEVDIGNAISIVVVLVILGIVLVIFIGLKISIKLILLHGACIAIICPHFGHKIL